MSSNDIVSKKNLLLLTEGENLKQSIISLVREIVDSKMTCIYVSLNKPAASVLNDLKGNGVDIEKVKIIDGISMSVGHVPKKEKNVIYMSDPSDLTGLSIAIGQFMESIPGDKCLVFDVLRTLLLYNDSKTVESFVKSMLSKSKEYDLAVRIVLLEKEDKLLYVEIKKLFSKTVKYNVR